MTTLKDWFDLQLFAQDSAGDEGGDAQSEDNAGGDKAEITAEIDISKMLNDKFAEWKSVQQSAADEAKRLDGLNEQEKSSLELQKLQKQLEAFQKKAALSDMTKSARRMLSDKQITVSDDLLAVLVTEDADTTKAAVEAFSKAYTEAVEAEVKKRMKGGTPTKGSGRPSMSKEKIMAIKDAELRQKAMLENRELFNF